MGGIFLLLIITKNAIDRWRFYEHYFFHHVLLIQYITSNKALLAALQACPSQPVWLR